MIYALLFLAGAFLCNALPHLIKGVCGERFYTPWAKPRGIGKSSALENILWGVANLLAAVVILDRTFGQIIPHGMIAVAAGFVVTAIASAMIFGGRQTKG